MELQYASSAFAERLLFSIKSPRNAKISPIAAHTYQRLFRLRIGAGGGAAGGGVSAAGRGGEVGGVCAAGSNRGIAIVAVVETEPGSSAARNAVMNSEQLVYRASGVLASALRRTPSPATSTVGLTDSAGGGSWYKVLVTSVAMLSASNGSRPASSAYATTASAYWSVRPEMASPFNCSGAMKCGEPTTAAVCVSVLLSSTLAMPKSAIFTTPADCRMMLPGLMSRCTTPLLCA